MLMKQLQNLSMCRGYSALQFRFGCALQVDQVLQDLLTR